MGREQDRGLTPSNKKDGAPVTHHVEKALKIIRKAYIKGNALELEKAKCLNVEENKFDNIPYGESKAIKLRDIRDIVKQARQQYAMTQEQAKVEMKSKKVGQPRRIAVDLVTEIVSEERRKRRESKTRQKLKSQVSMSKLSSTKEKGSPEPNPYAADLIYDDEMEGMIEGFDIRSPFREENTSRKFSSAQNTPVHPPFRTGKSQHFDFGLTNSNNNNNTAEEVRNTTTDTSATTTTETYNINQTNSSTDDININKSTTENNTFNSPLDRKQSTIGTPQRRPTSAYARTSMIGRGSTARKSMIGGIDIEAYRRMRSKDEFDEDEDEEDDDEYDEDYIPNFERSSSPLFSPSQTGGGSSSVANCSPSRVFRPSVLLSDEKIRVALQNRQRQTEMREQQLIQKWQERETRGATRQEQVVREARQQLWMKVVWTLGWYSIQHELVKKLRREEHERKHQSLARKAVRVIEKWWQVERINLKLRRHKRKDLLKLAIVRRAALHRIAKRKKGVALIKMFIRDSTGISDYMKKIYAFRGKALRVQKYVRSWLVVQDARLEMLYLAVEKYVKKRTELDRIETIKKERQALLTVGRMHGFADTLVEMNKMKDNIQVVYERQGHLLKRVASQQRRFEEELNKIREDNPLRKNNKSNLHINTNGGGDEDGNHNGTSYYNYNSYTPSKSAPGMYTIRCSRRQISRTLAERLKMILSHQRKRHLVSLEQEQEESTRATRPREAEINIESVRDFLRDPSSQTLIQGLFNKGATSMEVTTEQTARRLRYPLLLLLTAGGQEEIEQIPYLTWGINVNGKTLR